MGKIIGRNVPIADENITLSGDPAKSMFQDWSEKVSERSNDVFHDEDKPKTPEEKEKIIKELDELIKDKIDKR